MGHSQMTPSALGVTDLGEGDTPIMMDDDRRGRGIWLYYIIMTSFLSTIFSAKFSHFFTSLITQFKEM